MSFATQPSRAPWGTVLARVLLTFPFWESGLSKLLFFDAGVAEMTHFGLSPPALYNVATIAVQLLGSALIIAGYHAWLGAGALIVFTALTVPIAHHFWNLAGPERLDALHTASEHVGMIGALVLAGLASTSTRRRSWARDSQT